MNKPTSQKRNIPEKLLTTFLSVVLFVLVILAGYFIRMKDRIYPNILIAGINVGGMRMEEAYNLLSQKVDSPPSIKLTNEKQEFNLNLKEVGFSYDFKSSVERAYNITRTGNIVYDSVLRTNLIFKPISIGLSENFDEQKISKFISVVSGQDSEDPSEPKISISQGKVIVDKGRSGTEVDQKSLRAEIGNYLSNRNTGKIKIPLATVGRILTPEEAADAKERAENYLGKSILIKFEFNTFTLKDTDIVKFLDPAGGYNDTEIVKFVEKVSKTLNRPPQNPKFNFEGGRVIEFLPAKDGIAVDNERFRQDIVAALENFTSIPQQQVAFEVAVTKTPPTVSTEKVNDLGIKELIGRGTSSYFHSIPGRVHNVVLAASRINGTLVAPGETFSFNETLGDVSQFTGYQQAYIISGGKTILGDGGGVCQVSTTLFRALLNAGLPITERTSHAYRVGYYEQNSPPGLDATVYGPTPDLKFVNNTPAYILIEATADPAHYSLVFELYGTGDGRVATITKPVISNVTPALPTVYQDDPTLPFGTVKQVDFSAKGAKVSFDYKVTKDGTVIFQKTFLSNYRPWAAVYLRGTKSI